MCGVCRTPWAANVEYAVAMSSGCGDAVPSTLDRKSSRPAVSSGRPARTATSRVFSGPTVSLTSTYTVLTEFAVAFSRVISPKLDPPKFCTGRSLPEEST